MIAPANASSDLLNSWKEIAAYLNRGVRTVQRWEAEAGLPTRRPRGKRHSAVIAIRSEVDFWLKSRFLVTRTPNGVTTSNKELLLASRELRQTVAQARIRHHAALVELIKRVEKMTAESHFQRPSVILDHQD